MKRGEMRKEKKERKAKVRNKTKEKPKHKEEERKRRCRRLFSQILVRESLPCLYICKRSDCRILSRQEGKLFYKERTTRGLRFLGVSSNFKR